MDFYDWKVNRNERHLVLSVGAISRSTFGLKRTQVVQQIFGALPIVVIGSSNLWASQK